MSPNAVTKVGLPCFVVACLFTVVGCQKEDPSQAELGARFRAQSRKRIATVVKQARSSAPATPKVDDAAWKPEVRAAYRELLVMPATQKQAIIHKVLALAARGAEAREALGALVANRSLPEPQEAMSGMNYPRFFRFDIDKLLPLLDHPNGFLQRTVAELLRNHGGQRAIAALEKKRAHTRAKIFAKHLSDYVRSARKEALAPRANAQLDTLLNATDSERKKSAGVVLAVDYSPAADKDLLELIHLNVASKDTRMWAAIALAKGAEKDLLRLEAYTKRGHDKYLRYNAVLALGKLGAAGKAVLKKLVSTPGEPLERHIVKLLR